MTMTVYDYTDSGAPVLAGQEAKGIDLFVACLVSGYGSKPGAGWTLAFYDAATRTAVFRTATAPYAYLQVKDKGPGLGTFKEMRVRGYEAMTGADTGTGPFPTTAQRSNGWFVRKSATLDAVARPWVLAADGQRVYFFPETGDVANQVAPFLFGRGKSYKTVDDYAVLIAGRNSENSSTLGSGNDYAPILVPTIATASHAHLMRSYTGIGGAANIGFHTDTAKHNNTGTVHPGQSGMSYPMPADGGLYLATIYFHEANVPRGEVPGLWCPLHNRPLAHRDTFSGVEGLTGRDFLALTTGSGQIFLETSDTWNT